MRNSKAGKASWTFPGTSSGSKIVKQNSFYPLPFSKIISK